MDSEGKFFEYFEWARGEGIKWNKIEWFFNHGSAGIRAIAEIQPGDEIISVPNSCMISEEVTMNSEIGIIFIENEHFFRRNNQDSQIIMFATFLIWEKSKEKNSKWFYYINSQPKAFKLTQDWSEEELRELQDEDLVKMSKLRMTSEMKIYSQWSRVIKNYPQYFSKNMIKYKNFDWAYKLVKTRCFIHPTEKVILVPVAELMNHGNNCASYHWYKEDRKLKEEIINQLASDTSYLGLIPNENIISVQEVSKIINGSEASDNDIDIFNIMIIVDSNCLVEIGKEVFLSYGKHSNRELLLDYGFTLNENIYDYAIIDISEDRLLKSWGSKERHRFIVRKNELCEGKTNK